MLEILLAFLNNLKIVFTICAILSAVGVVMFSVYTFVELKINSEIRPKEDLVKFVYAKTLLKKLVFVPIILGVLVCIPNIDDMWHVRISLIKYELASPENLSKTEAVIERIGKKLECKYLGCEKQ